MIAYTTWQSSRWRPGVLWVFCSCLVLLFVFALDSVVARLTCLIIWGRLPTKRNDAMTIRSMLVNSIALWRPAEICEWARAAIDVVNMFKRVLNKVQISLDGPDQTLSETQVYHPVSHEVRSSPLGCPTSSRTLSVVVDLSVQSRHVRILSVGLVGSQTVCGSA